VRPTMIFGHGRDRNISTLVRTILRSPVVPVVGGAALVAPVHVDDVAEFVVGHKSTFDAGLYGLPGPESLPLSELVQDLAAIAGRRGILAKIPKKLLTHLSAVARVMPFLPLRPDQLLRAMEDRDTTGAPSATSVGWTPRPLAHRLEQAVDEIRFHPHDPTGFRTGVDSGDA
jgi:nucleoside-diphosphate-sugar epimerase